MSSTSNSVGTGATSESRAIEHYDSLLIRINQALQIIDDVLVPSTIQKLVRRDRILKCEKLILNIMGGVAGSGLNYILARVKLGLIIYKIKDHRSSLNNHNRTSLIELLAVTRLNVLNTVSRVHLLHALQLLGLSANKRGEHWVRNILMKTHGKDLSRLKTLVDSKGDYHCMNKLINEDIKSKDVRDDILAHFAAQESSGTRKVLSDVDDTLTCSGGVYPAGIDRRFARKALYPGVCSFYRELDTDYDGDVGNLTFLSARPHLYKDWGESHSFEKFEKMKAKGLLHCTPSLLAGDMKSGTEFLTKNNYEPLAMKKYRNFEDYVCIYPEYKHIFIGDNGQGDMKAALYMMAGFPELVQAIYIHVVQPIPKTHGYKEWFYGDSGPQQQQQQLNDGATEDANSVHSIPASPSTNTPPPTPSRKQVNCPATALPRFYSSASTQIPMHFFHTYVGAALHAHLHTFIDTPSLLQICFDAVLDYTRILKWPSIGSLKNSKAIRGLEINNDLWRVNRYVRAISQAGSLGHDIAPLDVKVYAPGKEQSSPTLEEINFVPYILFERKWSAGDLISTPYGRGRVLEGYDSVWDLYEVELDWRPLDLQISDYQLRIATEKREGPKPKTPAEDIPDEKSTAPKSLAPSVSADDNNVGSSAAEADSLHKEIIPCVSASESIVTEKKANHKVSDSSISSSVSSYVVQNDDKASSVAQSDQSEGLKALILDLSLENTALIPVTENTGVEINPPKDQMESNAIEQSPPVASPINAKGEGMSPSIIASSFKPPNKEAVVATICGRQISAYTVPVIRKQGTSRFAFFSKRESTESETAKKEKDKDGLSVGKLINTPYGKGQITRLEGTISVALSYGTLHCTRASILIWMKEDNQDTILGSLTSRFTFFTKRESDVAEVEKGGKDKHGLTVGKVVNTPYGKGTVSCIEDTITVALPFGTLHCSRQSLQNWSKEDNQGNILSSLTSLVTNLLPTTRSNAMTQVNSSSSEKRLYKQYFIDGAAVGTQYGNGRVVGFDERTGVYQVTLDWADNEQGPTAYLQRNVMTYCKCKGIEMKEPVRIKSLNLTGILERIVPNSGVHIVNVRGILMVCYVQPDDLEPIIATNGDSVSTPYGIGKMANYDPETRMFRVDLPWGTLFCCESCIDRVDDTNTQGLGGTRSNWFFRLILGSAGNKARSRGSSFADDGPIDYFMDPGPV
eukprot:CAMPEP_0196827012 /NCGR_PEP_ID=MMETSP1362-20130617/93925_1 /TAXON_ID=163516 /ORGANISM="Leptocylindrus danicus, Strain CCMP1856" /LENGTH=1194 /DNA_ID=CAMNT_0042207625 /DNA_START=937 /DNA_END=4521 /DNA_ORIENTATION=-